MTHDSAVRPCGLPRAASSASFCLAVGAVHVSRLGRVPIPPEQSSWLAVALSRSVARRAGARRDADSAATASILHQTSPGERRPDHQQRLSPPRTAFDRSPPRRLAEPRARPHTNPRKLAQPSRDLLLSRATQGPHSQRLPRPRRPRATPPRVRPPLRTDRHAIRMEIHPRRLRMRPTATRPPHRQNRLTKIRRRTSEPEQQTWLHR